MPRSRLALICLTGAVLVAACVPAEEGPSTAGDLVVERTVEDGTEVVRNLSGSVWPAPAHLEPIATIGGEAAEEYMFASPTGIWATATEVLVADVRAANVRAYDRSGAYLRSYGRPGEGPGEFETPFGVGVRPDGNVVVMGFMKVIFFTPDGGYLGEWRVPWGEDGYTASSGPPLLLNDGRVVRHAGKRDPAAASRDDVDWAWLEIGPGGWAGEPRRAPETEPSPPSLSYPCPDGQSSCLYSVPYTPRAAQRLLPDGAFVTAPPDAYEFRIDRPDGTSTIVSRTLAPPPVTDFERDYALVSVVARIRRGTPGFDGSGVEIPSHKPPRGGFVVSHDDRIYVARERGSHWNATACGPQADWTPEDDTWNCLEPELVVDAFARDGSYLGYFPVPRQARLPVSHIANDEIWTWAVADDDNYVIQGYRLVIPGTAEDS